MSEKQRIRHINLKTLNSFIKIYGSRKQMSDFNSPDKKAFSVIPDMRKHFLKDNKKLMTMKIIEIN